jgi:uncharacterized cofD-like protein
MIENRPSVEEMQQRLEEVTARKVAALDVLPEGNVEERVISLLIGGIPAGTSRAISARFAALIESIREVDSNDTRVVIFGGGTGLSNIVGGDSRRQDWVQSPFKGLKEIFPYCNSIVCVTDDGGSTGELLKVLPLLALGDLRHVLLSSLEKNKLVAKYGLSHNQVNRLATALHAVFNYRFISRPQNYRHLLDDTGADLEDIPEKLLSFLYGLSKALFTDKRLSPVLQSPQCLGNLLLASVIYKQLSPDLSATELAAAYQVVRTATILGLAEFCTVLGLAPQAVLPCVTTSARLKLLYGNGVLVSGEDKSSRGQRGYPVDRVFVEFGHEPFVQPEVINLINKADILIFAPGSLFTSIIPIMQVPGIARAIRSNKRAMKLLVANIWVQKGETDTARDNPERKFHVSDLINAYKRNIPGGVEGIFSHVLAMDLADIPGSVLQRYGIEDKEPIYLDRKKVKDHGLSVIAAPVFSRSMLKNRLVIQHDPHALAIAVKALHSLGRANDSDDGDRSASRQEAGSSVQFIGKENSLPCLRYESIDSWCKHISTEKLALTSRCEDKLAGNERKRLLARVKEIIWHHPDILVDHLHLVKGVTIVELSCWKRCQQWDNVFSFYDPLDQRIKIRQDMVEDSRRFEIAFLVGLGQSLLGNYAKGKEMKDIFLDGEVVGRSYFLTVKDEGELESFFPLPVLCRYLKLVKMSPFPRRDGVFTRLVNGEEGFTPPGLFFGLFYVWCLDNRFAPNIEYKMSIMKKETSDMISEQIRTGHRRSKLISFFRDYVFMHQGLVHR